MIILIYLGIGAVIGLLLNYLADVLPATRKFSRPVCVKCGHKFSAGEYLFSFQCPECKAKPNTRYWIVLVLSMVLSIALVIFPLYPFNYWLSLPLVTFLSLVLIIDVEHRAVLFETDIAGILICIIYGLLLHTPLTTIIGALFGAGVMFILFYGGMLFNRVIGKLRKQEIEEVALGFGDVIVCGYLGLITGWPHAVGMVTIAILLGGLFSIGYILVKVVTKKYTAFSAIPYAPFLIIATIIMFYLP